MENENETKEQGSKPTKKSIGLLVLIIFFGLSTIIIMPIVVKKAFQDMNRESTETPEISTEERFNGSNITEEELTVIRKGTSAIYGNELLFVVDEYGADAFIGTMGEDEKSFGDYERGDKITVTLTTDGKLVKFDGDDKIYSYSYN